MIKSAMEDGSSDRQIVGGLRKDSDPFDLAVDSYAGSLYWSDSADDTIKFIHFKGDNVPSIIFAKKKGYKPRNLVVSAEEGYVNQFLWRCLLLDKDTRRYRVRPKCRMFEEK